MSQEWIEEHGLEHGAIASQADARIIPRRWFCAPLKGRSRTALLTIELVGKKARSGHYYRVHEQNNWTKGVSIMYSKRTNVTNRMAMLHHDTPYRDQPPLSNREHEKPNRGSSRRPRSARWPT
jgi:hypothetical protein